MAWVFPSGGLWVSVQASLGEAFYEPLAKQAMMRAVIEGGAFGLRLAGPDDIAWARNQWPALPIIGITKPDPLPDQWQSLVYITPTLDAMVTVAQAGATVVATDGTQRPRGDDLSLSETLRLFKQLCPNTLVMADCDSLASAQAAVLAGVDAVATTLSGYTQDSAVQGSPHPYEPDWALLYQLTQQLTVPVVMEGRLWDPAQVAKAFRLGASQVVVGSAISRPHQITQRLVQAAVQPIGLQ
ncbi:MAG: putative N-acetylmannosamine-6-phosphate 2-epimerase [Vampirovibrionales bacterium]